MTFQKEIFIALVCIFIAGCDGTSSFRHDLEASGWKGVKFENSGGDWYGVRAISSNNGKKYFLGRFKSVSMLTQGNGPTYDGNGPCEISDEEYAANTITMEMLIKQRDQNKGIAQP